MRPILPSPDEVVQGVRGHPTAMNTAREPSTDSHVVGLNLFNAAR